MSEKKTKNPVEITWKKVSMLFVLSIPLCGVLAVVGLILIGLVAAAACPAFAYFLFSYLKERSYNKSYKGRKGKAREKNNFDFLQMIRLDKNAEKK